MKIILVMWLFNVSSGLLHDPSPVGKPYDSIESCLKVTSEFEPEHPDSKGDVKLYTCEVPVTNL